MKDFKILTKFLFNKEPNTAFEEKFFRKLYDSEYYKEELEELEKKPKSEWNVPKDRVETFVYDKLNKLKEVTEHQIKTIRIYNRSTNYSLVKSILVEDLPLDQTNYESNLPSVLHFKNCIYYFKRIHKERKSEAEEPEEDAESKKSQAEEEDKKEEEKKD